MDGFQIRETIELGTTKVADKDGVDKLMLELGLFEEYGEGKYHFLSRNENNFAAELSTALVKQGSERCPFPDYVNNRAETNRTTSLLKLGEPPLKSVNVYLKISKRKKSENMKMADAEGLEGKTNAEELEGEAKPLDLEGRREPVDLEGRTELQNELEGKREEVDHEGRTELQNELEGKTSERKKSENMKLAGAEGLEGKTNAEELEGEAKPLDLEGRREPVDFEGRTELQNDLEGKTEEVDHEGRTVLQNELEGKREEVGLEGKTNVEELEGEAKPLDLEARREPVDLEGRTELQNELEGKREEVDHEGRTVLQNELEARTEPEELEDEPQEEQLEKSESVVIGQLEFFWSGNTFKVVEDNSLGGEELYLGYTNESGDEILAKAVGARRTIINLFDQKNQLEKEFLFARYFGNEFRIQCGKKSKVEAA